MDEPPPMWIVFPNVPADEPHTQGAVDDFIEYDWLPFWKTLSEEAKATYLDRHGATRAWREAIVFRYEWDGVDEDGDPIWRTPHWLRREV